MEVFQINRIKIGVRVRGFLHYRQINLGLVIQVPVR